MFTKLFLERRNRACSQDIRSVLCNTRSNAGIECIQYGLDHIVGGILRRRIGVLCHFSGVCTDWCEGYAKPCQGIKCSIISKCCYVRETIKYEKHLLPKLFQKWKNPSPDEKSKILKSKKWCKIDQNSKLRKILLYNIWVFYVHYKI